jgi:predicted enzyme related to lactoylglutathione lyase
MQEVRRLGGTMLTDKMTVPTMGYLANCVDTEGNTFGLWEENREAR